MRLYVGAGVGATVEVEVDDEDGHVQIVTNPSSHVDSDVLPVQPGLYALFIDGRVYEVALEADSSASPSTGSVEIRALTRAGEIVTQVDDARTRALRTLRAQRAATHGGRAAAVTAPMPGRILAVRVTVGDRVERGQAVVVLEAMKMESALAAPEAGRVVAILVSAGQTVQQRQPLVRIEP